MYMISTFMYSISCIVNAYPVSLDKYFMQMNEPCFVLSEQKLECSNMYTVTIDDPYWKADLDYICNQLKKKDFTNGDLANLINYKFEYYNCPCNIHTIHNSSEIQFRDQCPEIYTHYCEKKFSISYFRWIIQSLF